MVDVPSLAINSMGSADKAGWFAKEAVLIASTAKSTSLGGASLVSFCVLVFLTFEALDFGLFI